MKKVLKFTLRVFGIVFEWTFIFLFILALYLALVIPVTIPEIDDMSALNLEKTVFDDQSCQVDDSWMRQNSQGIYEVYVQGSPFERGAKYGNLIYDINDTQEQAFVDQIEKMIPSSFYRFFLKVFVGWFNRDLDDNIPEEYMKELYGLSHFMSDRFDYVAPKFYRILNYHAAHDIGHALQGMHMVGCTSFALKGEETNHGELMIGRNFDFYVGKEFAEQKLVLIVNPDDGYGFVSYSWPGMMGVVSGMNEEGLTVTLNASTSDLPTGAKTPISILAREILQYAKTIDEAVAICEKRQVFVSESLLIGSAHDKKAVLIEKAPNGIGVYDPNTDRLVCSNHFQSETFFDMENNQENIKNSDSQYRYDRVNQLLNQNGKNSIYQMASILRNRFGMDNRFVGLGNPKTLNQLIANHSVLFYPEKKLFWISTSHFQLGKFICYDLNKIFKNDDVDRQASIVVDSLEIQEDPFIRSADFKNYLKFKDLKEEIQFSTMFGRDFDLSQEEIDDLIKWNPESYITYKTLGDYYKMKEDKDNARLMYETALSKSIASKYEELEIEEILEEL